MTADSLSKATTRLAVHQSQKHACPFCRHGFPLPFSQAKAKAKRLLAAWFPDRWKTLCPIPGKAKWLVNNADAVMLLFASLMFMDDDRRIVRVLLFMLIS
jgi:hypothetical protein